MGGTMIKEDFNKIVEYIEGAYNRNLDKKELILLKDELKDYTYESFMSELKFTLLKKVEYFTIQKLYKVIEENQELQELKSRLGIKSFDELYEN
jgi:hypothetical protein